MATEVEGYYAQGRLHHRLHLHTFRLHPPSPRSISTSQIWVNIPNNYGVEMPQSIRAYFSALSFVSVGIDDIYPSECIGDLRAQLLITALSALVELRGCKCFEGREGCAGESARCLLHWATRPQSPVAPGKLP